MSDYVIVTYEYKAADIHGVDCLFLTPGKYSIDIKPLAEQKLGFYIDRLTIQSVKPIIF